MDAPKYKALAIGGPLHGLKGRGGFKMSDNLTNAIMRKIKEAVPDAPIIVYDAPGSATPNVSMKRGDTSVTVDSIRLEDVRLAAEILMERSNP